MIGKWNKSVILTYPLLLKTRFSGLISLWIILLLCIYSNPNTIQARKNPILKFYNFIYLLVCSSLKHLFFII